MYSRASADRNLVNILHVFISCFILVIIIVNYACEGKRNDWGLKHRTINHMDFQGLYAEIALQIHAFFFSHWCLSPNFSLSEIHCPYVLCKSFQFSLNPTLLPPDPLFYSPQTFPLCRSHILPTTVTLILKSTVSPSGGWGCSTKMFEHTLSKLMADSLPEQFSPITPLMVMEW